MLLRLLKADLARGRAVAAVMVALVALAATLASASASLIIDTVSAVDRLSERARVPDLVQMHTGEADSRAIAEWADSRADVEDYMVMRTLPVPRAQLSIGGSHPGRLVPGARVRHRARAHRSAARRER